MSDDVNGGCRICRTKALFPFVSVNGKAGQCNSPDAWDRMGPNGTEWMFRLLSSGLCAFCGLGNACCRQWEPEPVLGVCASPAQ